LRWAAARGLLLSSLFGMSPLGKDEHQRLFARLLDDDQWRPLEKPAKVRIAKPRIAKARTAKAGATSAAKAGTARKRA